MEPPHQFHTIHMNFIDLNSQQGVRYALVVIDVSSKWVEIYPVKHADAVTITKCL